MDQEVSRVLLLDADDRLRRPLAEAMRRQGLRVDEASTISVGSRLLSEHTYTVILIEPDLPSGDGFEILAALPTRPSAAPVVLILTEPGSQKPAPPTVHAVFRKPVDTEDVAEVVAACVEARGRSGFEAMAIATLLSGTPLITLL